MSKEEDLIADEFWRKYLAGAQFAPLPSSKRQSFPENARNGTRATTDKILVENTTSDSIVIAAWAFVVAVHTLAEDVIFGLWLPENTTHRIDSTLPFRISVPEIGSTTSELIGNVQSSLAQFSSRQAESLDHISHLDASCKEACNLSTCLQILSSHVDGNCNTEPDNQSSKSESASISVRCLKSAERIEFYIDYDATVHTSEVSHALLRQFNSVIQAISSRNIPLSDLNLLGETEFETIIGRWTQFPEPVSSWPLLHEAVEEQARLNPTAVAIGQTDCAMSYGELNQGATLLAHHIIAMTRKIPGDKVGNLAILFEKSPFAILSMLAILKAGGAFVPIDIDWPEKRIQMVVEGADVQTILCSKAQQARLESFSVEAIPVNAQVVYNLKKKQKSHSRSESEHLPRVRPSDPAYFMYTSGSTGRPKGIEISHSAITTSLDAMRREFGLTKHNRCLQFSAFTFDVSVGDIWLALSSGARLCLPTENERFALDSFIVSERCDFALLTPSAAATIDPSVAKKHLKSIFLIGEAPSSTLLQRIAPLHEPNVLRNTWGPTEASVICTESTPIRVNAKGMLSQSPRNIGKSIGCTMILVSSRNPNFLAPPYAPGEIALLGHTLATSYYRDVKKTDEAFRTDLAWMRDQRIRKRFGEEAISRVYLSGDIGRYSEEGDGSVIFMHRRGGYIKVNGFRIDPGEVEKAIADFDRSVDRATGGLSETDIAVDVFEPIMLSEEGGETRQALVCFFVNEKERSRRAGSCEALDMDQHIRMRVSRIAKSLQETVPEYMIPKFFIPVTNMPVSTSTKLDRKALLGLLGDTSWDGLSRKYGIEGDTK